MASTPGGQATNNTEIINVLTFIQQTTETLLATYTKKYNKTQLDSDAEIFCHLIKLRAHFKDINPKSNRDQENLPFQIKNGHLRTSTPM